MNNEPDFYENQVTILKYPIITDKAVRLIENNQYTFIVERNSTKLKIKKAIESFFQVKVIKINTCLLPRKNKRVGKYIGWKSQYKKAIVTLSENSKINLFVDN